MADFKQNKSRPADHRLRNDPVTNWQTAQAMLGQLGRLMNNCNSHAWRALILACAITWFGPITDLAAGSLMTPGASDLIRKSTEPFGLPTSAVYAGGIQDKWLGVMRKLDDERVQLALCDGDRERCASPAALRFLAIVDNARARDGRARLGEINRAVNLAIHPMSDQAQYGEIDVWSSPLVTFASGAGDCEDYAIAKFVALGQAGVPPEDVRIVVIRDTIHGEDHAVAAVRLDGHWLTLDNRRMAMVEDGYFRNTRPLFVIGQDGVRRYSDTPLVASAPDRGEEPPAAPNPAVQPVLISSAD
jgi:predicted transglutaminase-like cysteine proteinase